MLSELHTAAFLSQTLNIYLIQKKGRVLEKCTFVRARIFHHLNVLSEISVKHNIPQFIVKQIFYEKKIMTKKIVKLLNPMLIMDSRY